MSWISIMIVCAVIIPAVTCGMRYGMRHGMRYGMGYGLGDGDWSDGKLPPNRERIEALEAELDRRLEEIRVLDARVSELENRLDFTERLLATPSPQAAAER
ncbi:MAG TPA: hypothetical protein VGA42_10250 [Gemmatimonadales bacterium]